MSCTQALAEWGVESGELRVESEEWTVVVSASPTNEKISMGIFYVVKSKFQL